MSQTAASYKRHRFPPAVLSRRWWKFADGDLRRGEVTVSCGEINCPIGKGRGEGLPAVDLAHDDLP